MIFREKFVNLVVEYATLYGSKLLGALLVIFFGFWLIKLLVKIVDKVLAKSVIDISLHSFIKSILSISLKIVLFVTAAGMLGIPMTTFIAVLSAAGLAIGLTLKDSLSNFAGGILILIFRPFSVGDFIEVGDFMGSVKEIQVLYTTLTTPDNKKVIIPNGDLSNAKIVNYSSEETRRIDLIFGVGYNDDILKVKEILNKVVQEHDLILNDPEPIIGIKELADSSINFDVKVWCERQNYFDAKYSLYEQVKLTFDKEGISIPFPQMDVHMIKSEN